MEEEYGREGMASWTIERQLKAYSEHLDGTERYEVLWHAWKHNKRWLKQLLEWVAPSFPSYSRHDESHAISVLHNIEMLLGEPVIRRLSASDCFLILHVVYIHDIGMCVTHGDRKRLMVDPLFISFLKDVGKNGDSIMKKYADLLLSTFSDTDETMTREELMRMKLDIYYAVLYLVGEYTRTEHGTNSEKHLNEWIDAPEKLGIGFSTSGIPSRFYYTIGACASTHTESLFDAVLDLPKTDGGYVHDYMHPRFAAVMLQLGDALDLDSDRFHPLVKEFTGEMPHTSELHYEKHRSIRMLRISPEKITIEADCSSPEVLRLVKQECEGIRSILKNATFYWSAICPKELNACLPNMEPVKLLMCGEEIKDNLVNVRFEIQQNKAFNLLQGSNIYRKEKFVFLREIFQNAIDASKYQYWLDWKGSRWYTGDDREWMIDEMGDKLSPLSYPIEVEFHIAKKAKYGQSVSLVEKWPEEGGHEDDDCYEYGVLVRVIDHGVGITSEDIKEIADVGTSYGRRTGDMPSWLSPTAEFGIGLQSIFLVADTFTARTHPRTNENYEISFEATGDRGKGFINVTPLKGTQKMQSYGTCFEVFVRNSIRRKREEVPDSLGEIDRFCGDYQKEARIRYAKEMTIQMVFYLESLIGEKLFPVKVRLYDVDTPGTGWMYDSRINGKMEHLSIEVFRYRDGEMKYAIDSPTNERLSLEEERKEVTWAYRLWDSSYTLETLHTLTGTVEGTYHYALRTDEMKLYIWDSKENVYARFGVDRIQQIRKSLRRHERPDEAFETRIYYKGIYTTSMDLHYDADLLEYIDIKGKLEREYLTINRNDFTEEGYSYIQDKLYPDVLKAAHAALRDCMNNDADVAMVVKRSLEKKMETEPKKGQDILRKQSALLSAAALAGFAQIQKREEILVQEKDFPKNKWNEVLEEVSGFITLKEGFKRKDKWSQFSLFGILVFQYIENNDGTSWKVQEQNIADILNNKNQYAVFSKRERSGDAWAEYLVWLNYDSSKGGKPGERCPIEGWIDKLQSISDIQERRSIEEKIETWGEKLKRDLAQLPQDDVQRRIQSEQVKQKYFLNWMLEKIPCVALFSNEDGSVRVNILGLEYPKSMYQDRNTRCSVFQEMHDAWLDQGIERFYTITNAGYSMIEINSKPSSMYFVKKGKFARIGKNYILFPLKGETIGHLKRKMDYLNIYDTNSKGYRLFFPFIAFANHVKARIATWEEINTGENKNTELPEKINNLLNEILLDKGSKAYTEVMQRLTEKIGSINHDSYKFPDEPDWNDDPFSENEMGEHGTQEEILDDLLDYVYYDTNLQIEKWVERYLVPRYAYISQGNLKANPEKRRRVKEELMIECGLKETESNREQQKTWDNMISYLVRKQDSRLSREQYDEIYTLYISDIVDIFYFVYEHKLQKFLTDELGIIDYNEFIS